MKTYSQIVGDGGSEVLRQVVNRQHEITKRLSAFERIILVGSGKGGVGKSTITTRLALSFCHTGYKVCVLDADFNGPSLSRFFGLTNITPFPGPSGLVPPVTGDGIGLISYGSFLPADVALEFETVVDSESFVWRQTKEFSVFAELLSNTDWGDKDILLVDLPPGPERTAHFAEFFSGLGLRNKVVLILVTIPAAIAFEVVGRTITSLQKTKIPILGYIENMCGYFCASCNTVRPLFPTKGKMEFLIPCLGEIPFDPDLAAAADTGLNVGQFFAYPSAANVAGISKKLQNLLLSGRTDEVSLRAM